MPQAVFQSGWFTSAVAVHGNHNAPGMDMALVSGQLPPSGIPYAITGAYFEYSPQTQGGVEWAFIRRDAWNGPQLGRTVFMAGWCELSHDPAVLLPMGKIYLVGDGGECGAAAVRQHFQVDHHLGDHHHGMHSPHQRAAGQGAGGDIRHIVLERGAGGHQ